MTFSVSTKTRLDYFYVTPWLDWILWWLRFGFAIWYLGLRLRIWGLPVQHEPLSETDGCLSRSVPGLGWWYLLHSIIGPMNSENLKSWTSMIMKHHRMWTAFIRAHFNGTVLPAVILIVNVPLQAMKEFFKKQSVKKEARQTEITT